MNIKKIIMMCFLFKQALVLGMFNCCVSSEQEVSKEIISVKQEVFAYDKEQRPIHECETKEYSDRFIKIYSRISYENGSVKKVFETPIIIKRHVELKKK